jgi:hypothetical protein
MNKILTSLKYTKISTYSIFTVHQQIEFEIDNLSDIIAKSDTEAYKKVQ